MDIGATMTATVSVILPEAYGKENTGMLIDMVTSPMLIIKPS